MIINNELLMGYHSQNTLEAAILHYICLNVRTLTHNQFITLHLSELAELSGSTLNYTRCYTQLKAIINKPLFKINKNGHNVEVPLLISLATEEKEVAETGEGVIAIKVHPEIFNLIKKESNYTHVQEGSLIRLSTPITKRLYGILLHYYDVGDNFKNNGYYKVVLSDFKEMLGITGQYTCYSMFYKFIEKHLNEINERTELTVTVKPIKRGKKIVWWNFHITKNKAIEEKIREFFAAMIANQEINKKVKAMKEKEAIAATTFKDHTRYMPISREMSEFIGALQEVPKLNPAIINKIIAHVEVFGFESFLSYNKWMRRFAEIKEGKSNLTNPAGYVKKSFLG